MKVTCVIPTLGDRPKFIKQAHKLLKHQTIQPDDIITIQSDKGVTGNFRAGYNKISMGIMVAIEDDDYYPPTYIETIKRLWEEDTEIMGFDQTVYYHLGQRKYTEMTHPARASMFSTILKAGLKIDWPDDSYPFLDLELWKMYAFGKLKGKLIPGYKAIGIKHGIGKCGGAAHGDNFQYDNDDRSLSILHTLTQGDQFYINIANKL